MGKYERENQKIIEQVPYYMAIDLHYRILEKE